MENQTQPTPYDWELKKLKRKVIEKQYQIKLWQFLYHDCDIPENIVSMYVNSMDWDFIVDRLITRYESIIVLKMRAAMRIEINNVT